MEYSLRATFRIPNSADLRRRTLSFIDETGDRSSREVGGVDGAESFVEASSEDVRGVETTLWWCRVAIDVSSFESLEVGGLMPSDCCDRGLTGGMSTSLGDKQISPWLTGFSITAWARWTGFSMALQLLVTSSAETTDNLVGTISRISPLDAEEMLMVSLSTEDKASSSEV